MTKNDIPCGSCGTRGIVSHRSIWYNNDELWDKQLSWSTCAKANEGYAHVQLREKVSGFIFDGSLIFCKMSKEVVFLENRNLSSEVGSESKMSLSMNKTEDQDAPQGDSHCSNENGLFQVVVEPSAEVNNKSHWEFCIKCFKRN